MILHELKQRIKLFQNPSYAFFAMSGLFATLGNGFIYIAISWLSYKQYGSISGTALMMFCLWTPSIVFGPFFGVCADKYSKKTLIIMSSLVRGCAVILFSIVSLLGMQPNIFILALILGFFVSFFMPAAIPFLTNIMEKDQLAHANTTIDMLYELGTIIGIGISGLSILFFGITGSMLIGGIIFLLSTFFNLFMKENKKYIANTNENNNIAKKSFFKEYTESLQYLWNNKSTINLYFTQMLIMVLLMTIPVLLLPYIDEVLHVGTYEFSIFEVVFSAGAFLGGFLSTMMSKLIEIKLTLLLLLSILMSSLFIFSSIHNLQLAYLAYFFIGFSLSSWGLSISQTQLHTAEHYQGRLQATFNSIGGILILAIYLVMLYKGNKINIHNVYLSESIFSLIAIILIFFIKTTNNQKAAS